MANEQRKLIDIIWKHNLCVLIYFIPLANVKCKMCETFPLTWLLFPSFVCNFGKWMKQSTKLLYATVFFFSSKMSVSMLVCWAAPASFNWVKLVIVLLRTIRTPNWNHIEHDTNDRITKRAYLCTIFGGRNEFETNEIHANFVVCAFFSPLKYILTAVVLFITEKCFFSKCCLSFY